jgi:hypothetical protein
MSKLVISSRTKGYEMNVVAFTSPIFGSIASAQTRERAIHFVTKAAQPEAQFDVVFRGEHEYEEFQKFVRNQHQKSLTSASLLTFNWPQRNILNWTGLIKEFKAGGQRFDVAPRARFTVELVDSMMSRRTDFASASMGWRSIYGAAGPVGSVLAPPSLHEIQETWDIYGQDLTNRGVYAPPGVNQAPTGNLPVAPAESNPGIVTGSG